MNEAKFTPAPWVKSGHTIESKTGILRTRIAIVDNGIGIQDEEANAHLIAAAPEMYEMLEAMCYSSFQNCEIEALLKKARGGK